MRCGASDFVVEEAGPEELLAAVRNSVHQNRDFDVAPLVQLFGGANVTQKSSAEFALKLENLDEKLSRVLNQFEQGLSDQEIADSSNSSLMRVRQLFKRVLIHFEFATRAQLALALFEAGRLES
jgi:DNA-binding NarL/FixJ family response regulator